MAQAIERGIANKTSVGKLTIRFTTPFNNIPGVVVSPYWKGQGEQVGDSETIMAVTRRNFTVVSGNAANNYFVSWIAVGQR
jgi:hypothetical protein